MPPPKKRLKQEGGPAASAASSPAASPGRRRGADDDDTHDDSTAAWSDPDTEGLAHYDSEDLYRRRPNRWRGDRRAWAARTQAEQLTVAALHGARARDLAAHLYNTYALKRRAAEAEAAEKRDLPEALSAEDGHGQRAAREDSTARLRRDVKREPGDSGSDSEDYGRGYGHGYDDGDDVDEDDDDGDDDDPDHKGHVLTAASTGSRGSERGGRPWAPWPWWTAWPLRMHERLFDARPAQDSPDGAGSGDDDDGPGGRTDRAELPASEVLAEVLTATVLRLAKVRFRQRQRQWRRRRKRSRPALHRGGGQGQRQGETATARGQPPVVSADDALSAHLLRPGVGHVLAQTDRLLAVLHGVRAATAATATAPVGHGGDGGPRSWWALRDWSDVVGAAALAGFDRGVLARTAQRCADLFGQGMVLVDVGGEGGGRDGEGEDQPSSSVAHVVYGPRPLAQRFAHLQADDTCVADEDASVAVASYSGQLGPCPPLEPLGSELDPGTVPAATTGDDTTAEEDDLAAWRQRVPERYKAWYRDRRQRQQQLILQQQQILSPHPPQSPHAPHSPQQPQQESRRKTTPFVPGALQPVWRCRHKSCDRSAIGFERRSNLTRHMKLVHGE